ncbi:ZIP family zinc transporter [Natronosporangium hydrolyticum]|uniref:ZIP family zinc transporter n=1 Tax=Natronosporangium hydrolyticum TaxID=2811111 RepID=A0A895Y5S8_9ACTN|nr:ZIP family zinc transporter [Natronosporangium hydrolyticum]QSB12751.1 ZIP family zinc transporter [Natronosporangium hydrolyticum]
MWLAAGAGLLGGLALVIGAAVALSVQIPPRAVGWIMALGAGVLISALSIELAQDAYARAGGGVLAAGLAAGGLTFFLGSLLVSRAGPRHHKRCGDCRTPPPPGPGNAIALGSLLDGIPESVVIGVTVLADERIGVAVVAAVFLSNLAESISAGNGLRRAGHSPRWIMGLWGGIALASALAAAAGYLLLGGASPAAIAATQAFAAGAVLTMLADTMMPEAFDHAGPPTGLVTVLGFTVAFLLSQV